MNCDGCDTPARMLAPVVSAMVCEACWTDERSQHTAYQVISATNPEKFANHDGMPFVMLLDEATIQAVGINRAAGEANAMRLSKPDLFGLKPYQEPTDYRAVKVDSWQGKHIGWRSRAKVVA